MKKRFLLEWGALFLFLTIVLPLIYQFFIKGEEDILHFILLQIRFVAPSLSVLLAVLQYWRYKRVKRAELS
ncbi:MAG: hypothetical protein Q8J88_17945 [Bacteroidales bacterium]|nr:hypothetical protein [Bacteroidales bacterium]